ncbi:MAG: prolyl oligopeptidase family serine peptidase [Actinomycetota bacterium]
MSPKRSALVALVVLVATAMPVSAAPREDAPGSLPRVTQGPRPGPPILYAPPAESRLLENGPRWDADPLMISGAEAYRDGEFVYQDFLYDDHGPNTTNEPMAPPEPRPPTPVFGGMTGDVVYPTDAARYGFNAADLVELRIDADATSVAYRFTLNTLLVPDSTAVAVGIDTDGGAEETDWGHGIGNLGPVDLEHVLYTDGISASLDDTEVQVATDTTRNQIEVVVPRDVLDPGTGTWAHYAVTGIADGEGGFVPLADEPSETEPGGAHGSDAPPIFNVAFRYEADGDEPFYRSINPESLGTRSVGAGHWRDHGQARAIAARDISAFAAEVDFAAMAEGATSSNAPATGYMNRIYVSSLDLGEGVADERPWLLGNLQPYSVYIPESYEEGSPTPLTLILHSLSCTLNQFAVHAPNIYQDLAEERGAIALTTMGRGDDGWYLAEAEVDLFEAWADLAGNYTLDPERVAVNGYSMGGYGTFRMATMWPDLFGKAFPVVGPPAEGIKLVAESDDGDPTNTFHVLDNVRNIPFMIWNGAADELVPIAGTVTHAQRLEDLGYRFVQNIFTADHFLLSEVDDWSRGAEFLGDAAVNLDPAQVTFRVMPAADYPDLGLVHDHAYWVWDVRMRDEVGDPSTGLVDVRSLAFGEGGPEVETVRGGGVSPLPYVERGVAWSEVPTADPVNGLEVTLTNVATVTLGLTRARIDPRQVVTIDVASDGPAVLNLEAPWHPHARVVDSASGEAVSFERDRNVITIHLEEGERTLTIVPKG